MNPLNPLLLFFFSPDTQTAWGAQMRAPDDDHESPWLPDFITAAWPEDAVEGPQHPSNLPGFDSTKIYQPVFHPALGWEEKESPPIGGHSLESEAPVNGDS